MNKKLSNRRDVLKIMAGTAAAPLITVPNSKVFAQNKAPLRLLTVIDTYGLPTRNRNNMWIKSSSGDYPITADDLGTVLKPLEAYIENMIVISNISLESQIQTSDTNSHHVLATHCLTGSSPSTSARRAETSQTIKHASIDIHIGEYLSNQYGLPRQRPYDHLFFSDWGQRSGATFCYTRNGDQKRSIGGALNVRNTLFDNVQAASNNNPASMEDQIKIEILGAINDRLGRLVGDLKQANQSEVLAAYEESVNSVAQEIDLQSANVATIPAELMNGVQNARRGASDVSATPDMFKNIYHAFRYDLASSITYVFGGEKLNDSAHSFLYDASYNDTELQSLLSSGFHGASHRTDTTADKVHELIRTYYSEELAVLMDRLSTTTDIDGSMLLDNTVIFFTSQMSNNTHQTRNFPLMMLAGKNTNLITGYHYDCSNSTNNDLLTTLAQGVTMQDNSFGGHNRAGNYLASLNNGPITKMLKS